MFLQGHLYQASFPQVKFQMPAPYANTQCILVYKQQHVYFVTSNNSGLIRLLGLIKISCKHARTSVTWLISESLCPPWEISRDNGSNSPRTFAHSLEFEVFEIISLIGLVFSTMEHYTCELFCCLACDCNYHDEKLYDVNFTSRLFCTRQNIVFKALGRFESFLKLYMYIQIETFMCTIPSHKIKQLSN